MKYIGKPNLSVIDYYNNKLVFKFDKKGEFITEDKKLIKWMKENKNFIKCENNAKGEFICKHCGKDFTNKGLLLVHYRKEHPKER